MDQNVLSLSAVGGSWINMSSMYMY